VLNFAAMSIGLGLYVRFFFPHRDHYGIGRAILAPASKAFELLRIGVASGVSFSFEVTAFAAMTLFVGHLGILALSAHGVLFQFLALTFMIAYGIAGATQVRVGNAWGRGDPKGMVMAGWTGLGLAALLTGAVTTLFAIAPMPFLRVFTTDPAVIAAAAPVMIWVVLATVFDGGQSVMNSACRGRGDTWFPTLLHFGSYWFVMVPAAWVLAFGADQGLAGVYQAILAASVASLALMSLRFWHLSRAAP
jgi:MATE family multidrug resistance protein